MIIQKFSSGGGSGRWCWASELEAGGTRVRRWGSEFLLMSWLTHCFKCPYHQETSGTNIRMQTLLPMIQNVCGKSNYAFRRREHHWSCSVDFECFSVACFLDFFFNIGGIWLEKLLCSMVLFSYCSQKTLNIKNAMRGLYYISQAMKSSQKGLWRFL